MWFVQQLHGSMVLKHAAESEILRDGRPAPDVRSGKVCASPYCDNLGTIGVVADKVLLLRESIQESFEQAGFRMHEETTAEHDAQILGGRFHGKHNIIRPTTKRIIRTRKALLWLARRPRVTGREVERIVGHLCLLLLTDRSTLSILCHLHTFISDSYTK